MFFRKRLFVSFLRERPTFEERRRGRGELCRQQVTDSVKELMLVGTIWNLDCTNIMDSPQAKIDNSYRRFIFDFPYLCFTLVPSMLTSS